MKWQPPKDAVEVTAPATWQPPADAVVAPTPVAAPPQKKEAPGWFEPGSKSEALVRGFSQGATLGFGDELQALIRSIGSEQTYQQLRDEERAANAAAAQKNTGTYMLGNVAGSLPSALSITGLGKAAATRQAATSGRSVLAEQILANPANRTIGAIAARGGAVGAAGGLGAGTGDAQSQLTSAAIGAGLGAAVPAAISGAGLATRNVAAKIADVGKTTGRPIATAAAATEAQRRSKDALAGGVAGGIAGVTGAVPFMEGVVGGALAGAAGLPISTSAQIAAPFVRTAANVATRPAAGLATATTLALQNISGQQARKIAGQADQQIQQAVAAGQPSYAATFTALQQPAVRVAQQKLEEEPEEDEDEDETE